MTIYELYKVFISILAVIIFSFTNPQLTRTSDVLCYILYKITRHYLLTLFVDF